ncbi:MAG: hypothetical protein KBS44_00665 [Clostridiales bacterium]|nr:hypothetical protein [Candidatus Coliplasma equi]
MPTTSGLTDAAQTEQKKRKIYKFGWRIRKVNINKVENGQKCPFSSLYAFFVLSTKRRATSNYPNLPVSHIRLAPSAFSRLRFCCGVKKRALRILPPASSAPGGAGARICIHLAPPTTSGLTDAALPFREKEAKSF